MVGMCDAASVATPYATSYVTAPPGKSESAMATRLLTTRVGEFLPKGAALAAPPYQGVERRKEPRLDLPFPATVRGIDATGERFEEEVVLDSFSAHGLHVRLRRPVMHGTRLFICVKLWLGEGSDVRGARVALHGHVLRSESQPDGRCGIAVGFERHRFLYVNDSS